MQGQTEAGAAWRSIVSHVLKGVAQRGEVSRDERSILFELLVLRRSAGSAADELAILRRVAGAVHRLEFSLRHSASVDLLRARQELQGASAAWRKHLRELQRPDPEPAFVAAGGGTPAPSNDLRLAA